MNDQITDRYAQMFAPGPIPVCVIEGYERAAFLMNKVDAPAFNIRDLCIIAASALAGVGVTTIPVAAQRTEVNTMAPIPIAESYTTPPAAVQPQGGVMDAPTSISDKAKASTFDQLRTMKMGELQEHAKLKGLSIPDGLDEGQACEFLMGKPVTHRQHVAKKHTPPAPAAKAPKRMGQQRMLKMKIADLRAHALEHYDYKAPKSYSKATIAAVLKEKPPIK